MKLNITKEWLQKHQDEPDLPITAGTMTLGDVLEIARLQEEARYEQEKAAKRRKHGA